MVLLHRALEDDERKKKKEVHAPSLPETDSKSDTSGVVRLLNSWIREPGNYPKFRLRVFSRSDSVMNI